MLGAVPERRSSMNLPLRQRRARSLIERHALQASRVQHMAAAMMMAATRTQRPRQPTKTKGQFLW
jgi:hypothetical protein